MTSPSRRAFTAAALASLLVGCGGNESGRTATADRSGGTPPSEPPATEANGAKVNGAKPLARSVPVGLRIPAVGVDTPVIRLGLAPDGSMQVPPVTADDRAGWYRHSPTPGRVGPSVITGHVTVGAYGDGVFRHLARLRRGDRVTVRLENGTAAVFAVDAVRKVAKADFPADDVYGDVDRPELRLITCGGPRTDDGYLGNVIVFATLTATSP
ncbi:class F sortase [Streptomyces sp. IB2014 016-6]|uniref:class F sortase n=1 Tax=Streptomyces sp. IB2014 016-6 TaxID=2517818 RepID=UPI0011CA1BEB|nr:class F sortase [Streptomyces sp. IB2014 016-6]TXL88579.1 class F sortase [Streptomyces sp. IB2014 016-6]